MHLSQADKKAAKDGFKFVVLSPSGARKCYCTTVAEAKAEAGKGGKIVSLGRMRYTTQNPSSGAKQRARKVRSYGTGLYVEPDLSGRHARQLTKAAQVRQKASKLGPTYTKLMHKLAMEEAARVRNPTARMVGFQRNPTGRNIEAIRSILKRYLPKLYSVSKSECQTILDEFDQHPYDAHNFALVTFDKLRHRRKALIEPSKAVPLWYEHVGRDLIPLGYFSSRSAALKTLGDNLALSYELRGGTAPNKAALVKAYLKEADVGPLGAKLHPAKRRNPTWTTAAILAGGAYVYGRSAKVREKIKGAIDRAHSKLENPTAHMLGYQRNPRRKRNPEKLYKVSKAIQWKDGATTRVGETVGVTYTGNSPSLAVVHTAFGPKKMGIRNLHQYLKGYPKMPGLASLERMSYDGIAKTPTGHRVEPDGYGPDGSPSWLLVSGYV